MFMDGNIDFIRKYHIPGMPKFTHRTKNALYISPANSLLHEFYKVKVARMIKKSGHNFISEAVKNCDDRRVDLVDVDSGVEYEIELTEKRAARFKDMPDVIVIKVWTYKDHWGDEI